MHLVKKYTGTAMDRLLLDLMVQGVFEGANTPDFRDAVVLHRITKVPLPVGISLSALPGTERFQ